MKIQKNVTFYVSFALLHTISRTMVRVQLQSLHVSFRPSFARQHEHTYSFSCFWWRSWHTQIIWLSHSIVPDWWPEKCRLAVPCGSCDLERSWRPTYTVSDAETPPIVYIAMVLMRRQNIWCYTAQHTTRRGGSHGQISTIKATQDAYGASWRGSGRWPVPPTGNERDRERSNFSMACMFVWCVLICLQVDIVRGVPSVWSVAVLARLRVRAGVPAVWYKQFRICHLRWVVILSCWLFITLYQYTATRYQWRAEVNWKLFDYLTNFWTWEWVPKCHRRCSCCWCCCYQICDLLRLFHFITDCRQTSRTHRR